MAAEKRECAISCAAAGLALRIASGVAWLMLFASGGFGFYHANVRVASGSTLAGVFQGLMSVYFCTSGALGIMSEVRTPGIWKSVLVYFSFLTSYFGRGMFELLIGSIMLTIVRFGEGVGGAENLGLGDAHRPHPPPPSVCSHGRRSPTRPQSAATPPPPATGSPCSPAPPSSCAACCRLCFTRACVTRAAARGALLVGSRPLRVSRGGSLTMGRGAGGGGGGGRRPPPRPPAARGEAAQRAAQPAAWGGAAQGWG